MNESTDRNPADIEPQGSEAPDVVRETTQYIHTDTDGLELLEG